MSFNILHPLYPQPAYNGNTLLTSQVVTVTAGVTTTTAFAPTSPSQVQLVTFDVQTSDVRCFWEGSTPSASSGHLLPAGTAYTWSANQWANAKFFLDATGTASAVIVASPFNGG